MKPILKVQGVSKQFQIGVKRQEFRTLRDTLVNTATGMFRRKPTQKATDTFWALQDIHFEVNEGEVVGIIGRNGSGKSTLLKIISRITEPTHGRVLHRGRVGTLLEVGTGFHPELTGRENIYMNGAILGMSRQEITRKFDEIVDFSEVEKFIDTPVKRYSSGMYVRLAFAVAASLEPDILLVDEVLAVGDVAFQRKCMGKMSDVAQNGRTILFVSHQMAAIQSLCTRTIILDNGKNLMDGKVEEVIPLYLKQMESTPNADIANIHRRRSEWGTVAKIVDISLLNVQKEPTSVLALEQPFLVKVTIQAYEDIDAVSLELGIDTFLGAHVIVTASEESNLLLDLKAGETREITADFTGLAINVGQYTLRASLRRYKQPVDWLIQLNLFEVTPFRHETSNASPELVGLVRYYPKWSQADTDKTIL
jgi:lipopolysaccharide transport system ATP-binding protein